MACSDSNHCGTSYCFVGQPTPTPGILFDMCTFSLQPIKDAFGLRDSFEAKLLFTRSEGCKTIQMVTPDVGKLFLNNEKAIRKRRVVHAGMKVMSIHTMAFFGATRTQICLLLLL
jgi:hypothetical protein